MREKLRLRLPALAAVLLLLACGDEGTTPTAPPTPIATSITLSAMNLSFSSIGATQQLSATVRDQNGTTMSGASISWATSAASVARVSVTGLATSVADGTATITATSGSASATASVTVSETRPIPCLSTRSICAERIVIESDLYFPVFSTHSLTEGNGEVTRGLIVVHGTNRNADDYFRRAFEAAKLVGGQQRTVVVAPQFQTSSDGPASDEPFWSGSGWKMGSLSRPEGPSPRVSSYATIDSIVEILSDPSRFPALTEIVVAGHSAGGQVAHRYAATSRAEENLEAVSMRYVVANPSTYLYVGPERGFHWDLASETFLQNVGSTFVVPSVSTCPDDDGVIRNDYDNWHKGLQSPYNYAAVVGADTIRAQLVRRDVRILIGSADTLSSLLDVSCAANLQGSHRFERGRTLMRFMDWFSSVHQHLEMIVTGVGHSSSGMFSSALGLEALFGT